MEKQKEQALWQKLLHNNFYRMFLILFLLVIFFLINFFQQLDWQEVVFDPTLIDRYFLSQDITHEVAGKRLFLSDAEIHQASAYLYYHHYDPTEINFQHPPLIKYLFGLAINYLHSFVFVQIAFALGLIVFTYLFGERVFHSKIVALLGAIFLASDRLLSSLTGTALLDLGQAFFILVYLYVLLEKPEKTCLVGFLLASIALSKFWATALFFIIFSWLFTLLQNSQIDRNLLRTLLPGQKNKVSYQRFFKYLLWAGLFFSVFYLPTFIHQGIKFNLIFFELRTLKYWFAHSVTSIPLASLLMFNTGYYQSWWGDRVWLRTTNWSILWPIMFFISIYSIYVYLRRSRKIKAQFFCLLLPILYLFYLGIQAPFERYFIIILPYFYLILANFLVQFFSKKTKIKN